MEPGRLFRKCSLPKRVDNAPHRRSAQAKSTPRSIRGAVREPGGRTAWDGLLCCLVQRTTEFLAPLKKRGVSISMDGRGRVLDNDFIERLWRSLKYELGALFGQEGQ
jgi:hypothetical protein